MHRHITQYLHHEVTRQSPMRIHDVVGEPVVYYTHHEYPLFIAKRLHEKKLVWLSRHHECGKLKFINVRTNLLSTFMIEEENSNGFGIKRLRIKKPVGKKGTVKNCEGGSERIRALNSDQTGSI
jgi:hypothetical protein